MSPNQIFPIVNCVAMVGWMLLAVLPGRRWVVDGVAGRAIPALLAAIYIAIVVTQFAGKRWRLLVLAGRGRRFSATRGCCSPDGSTTWRSICSSAAGKCATRASAASRTCFVLPCLLLTFLFGPSGWLAYLVVRSVRKG